MKRQVTLELIYDQKDITLDIWQFVESFKYVDRTSSDKMDELSLTLQDVAGLWRNNWFPQAGAKFNAKIKAHNWFNVGDSFERDCGGFEIDDLTSSGFPSTFNISAVSVGITNSIRRQQNSKAWENIDLKTIAQDIADQHGFELQFYSNHNPTVERWEQKSESDLSSLKKLCEYAGFMLKITNSSIVVFSSEEFDKETAEIKIRYSGDGVKSYSFNSNSSDVYSACEVKYYAPDKKELLEHLFVPEGINGLSQASEITEPEVGQVLKINRRCTNLAEAQEIAKSALRSKNMRQTTGSISLMGRPDLYSGMNISIEGFGVWDSVIWQVEEVTHDYSRSGYGSTIQLRGILGY